MFKKSFVVLVLLLCASPAWAQYTSKKIAAVDAADEKGQIHVVVVFSGTNVPSVKREYFPIDVQSFRQQVASDLGELNKKQTSTKDLQVGEEVPDPGVVVPPPPPPPTEDELAVAAFTQALIAWRVAREKVPLGLAATGDVDTALAALVSLYTKGTDSQKGLFDKVIDNVSRGVF